MFTRDIYSHVSLRRSSVKWASGPRSGAEGSDVVQKPKLVTMMLEIEANTSASREAKDNLIKSRLKYATPEDQKAFRDWLDAKIAELNAKTDPKSKREYAHVLKLDAFFKEVVPSPSIPASVPPANLAGTVGVSPDATPETRRLVTLQQGENTDALGAFMRERGIITNETQQRTIAAVPAIAPITSASGAQRPIERSKDPMVKSLFEGYAGGVVSKEALAISVSRAVAYTDGGWQKVYENVVGEKAGDKPDGKRFQVALDQSVRILQQLGGGNAGMDALLQGKTDVYFAQIRAAVTRNGNKPLTIDLKGIDPSTLSPATQTLLGAGLTLVAGIASGGLIMAGHEADAVTADTFVNEFNADKKGEFWNGLGNALTWLKEAAMGRRASITLFANQSEGNVEKYYEDIRSYTKAVMEGKYDTHPVLKEVYPTAQKLAQTAGVDVHSDTFKKALIQSYILNEGFARQGTDWKANIGLLFLGGGREEIVSRRAQTVEGGYGQIERGITKSEVPSESLTEAGITIDRDLQTKKWIHIIPGEIQLPGDQSPLKVVVRGMTPDAQGKYKIENDKVQTFHFSDLGNGMYELTYKDAANQPELSVITVPPTADRPKQGFSGVRNIRDNDPKFALESQLYYVGHADPKVWGEFLRALGAQNIVGAKAALDVIEQGKKYPALAKALKLNFDTIALQGNTYTYGNTNTRNLVSPDQAGVDSMRTPEVIAAEKRLLEAVGITHLEPEASFKTEKYTPRQASTLYPDQEMTLMVCATPKYKNERTNKFEMGTHRIDTMDGSFAVHSKTVPLPGEARDQVIDALATKGLVKNKEKGVQGQIDKLNAFLKANAKADTQHPVISLDQYVKYLKSGKIEDLGVKGLKEQAGKSLQVFEARAMIAGNVCMNRTHGIVYPLFELEVEGKTVPVAQSAKPVANLDWTTPTSVAGVEARSSALGLSPAAIYARTHRPGQRPDTSSSTTPTENRTPGTPGTPASNPNASTTVTQTVNGTNSAGSAPAVTAGAGSNTVSSGATRLPSGPVSAPPAQSTAPIDAVAGTASSTTGATRTVEGVATIPGATSRTNQILEGVNKTTTATAIGVETAQALGQQDNRPQSSTQLPR